MDKAINSEAWRKICPPLYQRTDPAQLPQAPLKQVMSWKYGPRGLILYGSTGTGKTRAAWLLLQRVMSEGIGVIVFNCTEFGNEIADKFREGEARWWLSHWAKASLVFFDDIDKTRFTERVQAEFFTLIEARCANCLPTLITTNVLGDTIERALPKVGRPLVRRLRETDFFQPVNFEEGEESKR